MVKVRSGVLTLLPQNFEWRDVQPVGRLDYDTTGLLLLSGRFVPLALVLLSPVLVNIVLFHASLNEPKEVIPPLIFLAVHLFLVWQYRASYTTLFSAKAMLNKTANATGK